MGTAEVLAYEPDLMFSSRIEAACAKAGIPATIATDLDTLIQRLKRGAPEIVFLNLDASEGRLTALEPFTKNRGPRYVGYYSHLNTQLGEDARRIGINVFSRGAFVSNLESILKGLVSA